MSSSNGSRVSPAKSTSTSPLHFGKPAQHVLVTGATGFIGRQLVRALRADGHAVSAWTRDPRAAGRRLGDGVRCVARLQDLPPSPSVDVIVNLAGAPIFGPRWTAARQATLLLSGSAIGYYGVQSQDDSNALTEASPPTAEFMSEPQIYNFTAPGAPGALTHESFARIAAEVLHRPCILPTPGWPVRLALGEQSDLLLEGQRVAPERLLRTGFRFAFPDAKGALKDLC
ncbi:MAG: DUF1731 domain-containing protein [Janthinobacterium lividum]